MGGQELPYKCDLIMKGGITSGVVYPPAIAELAKDHRFYSIGGASAGALAAAAAAAAEFGRQNGTNPTAFEEMKGINKEVSRPSTTGKKTVLENFIQPQASTRRYFDLAWALKKAFSKSATADCKSPPLSTRARLMAKALALFVRGLVTHAITTKPLAILGILLTAVALLVAVFVPNSLATGIIVGIVVCLGLFLWAAGSFQNLYGSFQDRFVDNHLGLCNGTTPDKKGITDWLHEKIQLLAFGRTPNGCHPPRPLTYGDLDAFDIELVTMTTNASQGESLAFPFADEDAWAFNPTDAKALLLSLIHI